jgi:hypothetical protein
MSNLVWLAPHVPSAGDCLGVVLFWLLLLLDYVFEPVLEMLLHLRVKLHLEELLFRLLLQRGKGITGAGQEFVPDYGLFHIVIRLHQVEHLAVLNVLHAPVPAFNGVGFAD